MGESVCRSFHQADVRYTGVPPRKATETVFVFPDGLAGRKPHPPDHLTGVLISPGIHGCCAPVDVAAGRGARW
ncbi:hypothetical protein HL657_02175 [Methanoculleus sp. YWC-01]|uniref:Uncharacterized protein n=1 Tax=Methanoculleus nereidis TaxID=2735141 RepID=A0ABU3YZM8_9EURY|nr:hypothetical protein [Methanoculleus sp. YWC-01]MDV4342004.1 hypothetical protein [Methanoculleus sp. YWC-01]